MPTKILTFLTQYVNGDKWYEYTARANKIYENITSNKLISWPIWLISKLPLLFIILTAKKIVLKNITDTQRKYVYIYCVIMWIILGFIASYFLHPYKFMDRLYYLLH